MVAKSPRVLLRVLLVEDQQTLRENLQILIERKLRGSEVIAVGTIEDAINLLTKQTDFAIGVLDIRLPMKRGLQPEADPSIAERLRELGIPSVCITGHRQSEDVENYIKSRSLVDPPVAVIEKRVTSDFTKQLLEELRGWFTKTASLRVNRLLERAFGNSAELSGVRSGTAALLSLQQDIRDYWHYLDGAVRSEIRKMFIAEEEDDGRIALELFSGRSRP